MHGPTRQHFAECTEIVEEICEQEGCLTFRPGLDRGEKDRFLEARYAMAEMIQQANPEQSRIVIDVAVPISAYTEMILFAREAAMKEERGITAYTFGHAGDGNIHLVVGTLRDKCPRMASHRCLEQSGS